MTDLAPEIRHRRRMRRLVDTLGRWSATGIIVGAVIGLVISGGLYDGLVILLGGLVGMIIGAGLFAFLRATRQRP